MFQLPYLVPKGLTKLELMEDMRLSNVLVVKSGIKINTTSIASQ